MDILSIHTDNDGRDGELILTDGSTFTCEREMFFTLVVLRNDSRLYTAGYPVHIQYYFPDTESFITSA